MCLCSHITNIYFTWLIFSKDTGDVFKRSAFLMANKERGTGSQSLVNLPQ